jgi:hypothetical protein
MTYTPPTEEPEQEPQSDPAAEEESRRQRAAREKAEHDMKLENLMLRAGLDPESAEQPINKLFFEGYRGDLTSEAVLEAAKSYGLVRPPEDGPSGDVTDPEERRQTLDRQVASGGAKPDAETPSEDPRITALKVGQEMLDAGSTQEAAFGRAFDEIAAAGFGEKATGRAPDPRAQWDPEKLDPRRRDLGW